MVAVLVELQGKNEQQDTVLAKQQEEDKTLQAGINDVGDSLRKLDARVESGEEMLSKVANDLAQTRSQQMVVETHALQALEGVQANTALASQALAAAEQVRFQKCPVPTLPAGASADYRGLPVTELWPGATAKISCPSICPGGAKVYAKYYYGLGGKTVWKLFGAKKFKSNK